MKSSCRDKLIFAMITFLILGSCILGFFLGVIVMQSPLQANVPELTNIGVIDLTIATVIPPSIDNQTPLPFIEQSVSTGESIAFSDIILNLDEMGWTQAQIAEYEKSLNGLRAQKWQGTVVEAEESIGDSYIIHIDMAETTEAIDVYLFVDQQTALAVGNKGQQVIFSGTIDELYTENQKLAKVKIRDVTLN